MEAAAEAGAVAEAVVAAAVVAVAVVAAAAAPSVEVCSVVRAGIRYAQWRGPSPLSEDASVTGGGGVVRGQTML